MIDPVDRGAAGVLAERLTSPSPSQLNGVELVRASMAA
jgi:hypothetical protein